MSETSFEGFSTRIKTPADLRSRPEYVATLEVNDPELAEVISRYHFDNEYRCGRSGCGQGHKEGFLVRVATGEETNIGWKCGSRVFGDNFAIKANEQQRKARLAYQLDVISNVRARKNSVLGQIAALLDRQLGIKWMLATLRSFNEIVGHKAVRLLHDRARRNDAIVMNSRLATAQERENHAAKFPGGKPLTYVEEKAGELVGLEFLKYDVERAVATLKQKLYEIDRVDASSLTAHARKAWVDWALSIEQIFDQAEMTLAAASRFFNQANLDLAISLDPGVPSGQIYRWSEAGARFVHEKSPPRRTR